MTVGPFNVAMVMGKWLGSGPRCSLPPVLMAFSSDSLSIADIKKQANSLKVTLRSYQGH